MTGVADDPRLDALRAATARLTAPGAAFAVTEEAVRGERMLVFADRHRSLRAVLEAGAARGDADCYVFGDGTRLTFAGTERTAASIAAGLAAEHGIGPGDRIAICAANCPEWILLFWAAAALGAVVVAMNGWWTADEMARALALTEPALIVMDEKRRARLAVEPGAPVLRMEHDVAALDRDRSAPIPQTPIAEDDPFILIFTSGTTGRPKAAVLSHRSVIGYLQLQSFIAARSLALIGREAGAPPHRLAPFPLFHVSGLTATVSTMLGGGTTVWPLGRFDPGEVLALVRREQVGAWMGATTHMIRMLEHPDVELVDKSMVVQVGVGGSATTPAFTRRAQAVFPHLTGAFSSGYGSTETGGLVSWAPGWMVAAADDCVGPVMPTVDVRITDELGAVLPDGEEGNIEARSAIVMLGYWRNDDANAETVLPGLWVRTGDFGRIEDGVLFIASRRRDLIIRGGENIYPFEIEYRLEEHPAVAEAAVLGVDDDVLGQEVTAVVVVRDGHTVDARSLRAWCAETLASYKVPAVVELRTEPLPRNATGKIMKHVIAGAADSGFVED